MTEIQNILPAFKNKLRFIISSENEPSAERQVASFYLDIIDPYDYHNLVRQEGFGIVVGGRGDNIIAMPIVERDENGNPVIQDGKPQTTICMFDDFRAYLSHIERRVPVRHEGALWMSPPVSVNAIPREDYVAMFFRHMGWTRDHE